MKDVIGTSDMFGGSWSGDFKIRKLVVLKEGRIEGRYDRNRNANGIFEEWDKARKG